MNLLAHITISRTTARGALEKLSVGMGKSQLLALALLVFLAGCENKTAVDHINSAKASIEQGEYKEAKVELKNAVKLDAKNTQALSLLGQVRYIEGDYPAALENLNQASDTGQLSDPAQLILFSTKNKLGKYAEVIGELEGKLPLTESQQLVLADAYFAAQDPSQAAAYYEKNLHRSEGLLGMARVAYLERDPQRAFSFTEQAIAKSPENRDLWLLKAEIELGTNKTSDALASFAKSKTLVGGKLMGQMGVVRSHLAANDLETAKIEVEKLVKSAKNSPQAHYLSALVNFRAEDYSEAASAINRVEKLVKSFPPATYLNGAILYKQGKLDRAEKILRRELKRDATNVEIRKLLATIANDKNDPKTVVKLLQPVASQENDPQMWAMLGTALLRSGEAETGAAALQAAVDLAPDTPQLRNQLALGLLSSGKDGEAIEQLNSAVELGDDQNQSAYLLAMVKVREGDFAGANETVDGLIERSPQSPLGYQLRGSIAYAEKNEARALSSWNKALEVDPSYFPAAQNLARFEMQAGRAEKAKAIYQSLVDQENSSEKAQLALIDIAVARSNIGEAIELVNSAVERWPESAVARVGQARLLMATGELNGAKSSIEKAIEISGENATILLLQADIEMRSGDRKAAQKIAKKLETIISKNNTNAQMLTSVATLQMRLGELTRARRNLKRAIEMGDDTSAPALTGLAKLELADGNLREADRALEKLSTMGVRSEEIDLLHGDALVAGKKMQEALTHFSKLANGGSRVGTSRAALVAMQTNNLEFAETLLKRWLEKHPGDVGMKSLLATAQVQSGDQASAKVQYEAMLPTNDPVILNNLAWIYMTEGDAKALRFARQAAEAAPNNPDIEDTLGWILVGEDMLEEGIKYLQSSARKRPGSASVQYHLGVAYQKMGEVENAKKALSKALELGKFGEADEARKALESLSS